MKKLFIIAATLLYGSVWAIDKEFVKIWQERAQDVMERKPEHLMQKIEEKIELAVAMEQHDLSNFVVLIPLDIRAKAFPPTEAYIDWGTSEAQHNIISAQKFLPFLLNFVESTTAESLNDVESRLNKNMRDMAINDIFPTVIKLMGVEEYKKRATEELASKKAKYNKKCSNLIKYDKENAAEHEKLCVAKKLEVENVYKQRMEILAQVAAKLKEQN